MSNSPFASTIGANFSNTYQSNPVPDSTAATQISGTGIGVVKMFNYTETDAITDLISAGLQVLVDIPNDDLLILSDTTNEKYKETMSKVISVLSSGGSNIPMICVGNEPLGSWWGGAYTDHLVPALKNVKSNITSNKLSTKVTVPFNYAIMGTSYPPSAGALNSSVKTQVLDVCKVLSDDSSVFMVNIYPFITQHNDPKDISLEYCLFTSKKVVVQDGNYGYKNIFDAMYDALYVALGNNDYGSLQIVIGEIGWPTGPTTDYVTATVDNAQTFNQNLINHCLSGNGTPRNAGVEIPAFVFEMYDEDNKSTSPGTFETHWGVYGYNDTSKDYKAKYTLNWQGTSGS